MDPTFVLFLKCSLMGCPVNEIGCGRWPVVSSIGEILVDRRGCGESAKGAPVMRSDRPFGTNKMSSRIVEQKNERTDCTV